MTKITKRKKWFFGFAVIMAAVLMACSGGGAPEAEEEDLQHLVTEQRIFDEGTLHYPAGSITLLAYEDEMNLEETLGLPLAEESVILQNADTFTGSHQKTLVFQDTQLVLFSPPQDGLRFYLINIETDDPNAVTHRGISLSHTLEDLQEAYPEVTRSLDGTTGLDGRYEFLFPDNPYTYLFFFVEGGKVTKLQLLHEFP